MLWVSLSSSSDDLFFVFSYVSLQLSGFKKVLNYTKKVMEDVRYRKALSREEVLLHL